MAENYVIIKIWHFVIVAKGPIYDNPPLIQIVDSCLFGTNQLFEPIMVYWGIY